MTDMRGTLSLATAEELRSEEQFLGRTWDDFDHSRSVTLGLNPLHPTKIVFERRTNQEHVLQSCSQRDWTEPRARLLDIGRTKASFIAPHFMFISRGNVYVGSEVVYADSMRKTSSLGLTLADVIGSTLSMTERQAAAVLKQVGASSNVY